MRSSTPGAVKLGAEKIKEKIRAALTAHCRSAQRRTRCWPQTRHRSRGAAAFGAAPPSLLGRGRGANAAPRMLGGVRAGSSAKPVLGDLLKSPTGIASRQRRRDLHAIIIRSETTTGHPQIPVIDLQSAGAYPVSVELFPIGRRSRGRRHSIPFLAADLEIANRRDRSPRVDGPRHALPRGPLCAPRAPSHAGAETIWPLAAVVD